MEFSQLFYFFIIIPSAILHEYAHGAVADRLGDPTARYAGRLSLDPRVHIDLLGTILMPLFLFAVSGGRFLFAYAKPVPYNPYNLKDQRWGPVAVALAGPFTNFLLAFVFGAIVQVLPASSLSPFLSLIVYANVILAVFNLVPIPPLDGSKVLYALLPNGFGNVQLWLDRYGFYVLLIFVFFFFNLLQPVIDFVFRLATGGVGVF
ncbi:MAG: site-2 protease family protein [Patescibacteria group bacterium]